MQIGRVAQSTGLSVDTIRFYEKQSLIPLAQRTDAGYRVYDESTVDRLQLIGRAQSLGFSLQEIREFLLITWLHVNPIDTNTWRAQKADLLTPSLDRLSPLRSQVLEALRSALPSGPVQLRARGWGIL